MIVIFCSCEREGKKVQRVSKTLKEGTYRATLAVQDGKQLPFIFEVNRDKKITVLNATERIDINDVTLLNDSVLIKMPVFDAIIHAKIDDVGNLNGYYSKAPANKRVIFKAEYNVFSRYPKSKATSQTIEGNWEATFSPNTESEYKAIGVFKQGRENVVLGTFLTETGDYRFLEGVLDDGYLTLSCFDGAHAFLFDGTVVGNRITSGMFYSGNHYKESWVALKNENFELRNPEKLTYLKNGYDKVEFSFPNLNGKMISLDDERFKNKVVVVQVMGSWCPNCLDESKYLSEFYAKNKNEHFEIIALAFENSKTPDRAIANLKRLKARLGIDYEILLAQVGSSNKAKASEKLPMLNHILSYPTTLFIDKKNTVRKIHTGFNGPATGKKYRKFKIEFETFVARLTAE